MSAKKKRKRKPQKSAKERKRAQKSAKFAANERFSPKFANNLVPGLKQSGLGTPKASEKQGLDSTLTDFNRQVAA